MIAVVVVAVMIWKKNKMSLLMMRKKGNIAVACGFQEGVQIIT